MTQTHCFSSFVDCYFLCEKRLVFDSALPDSPPASTSGRGDEIVGEIMTAIKQIKESAEPTNENLQKLKEQVVLKLQELKGVIIDSSKLNEVMKALNADAEKINEEVKPAIDALKGVTQEVIQFRGRIEGLLKGGEKPEDALLGEGKFGFDALRKSLGSFGKYVPEAIGGFFHSMGDSTILRMVQRGFFTFMANLDQSKIVPGFLKPFLKNQVEGAKQSLLRLDAEDGIREAIAIQEKEKKTFRVVWNDTVWETLWLPELAKRDASQRSGVVKQWVLTYLEKQPTTPGTRRDIDMKDIPLEKTAAVSPAAVTTGPAEAIREPESFADFKLDRKWKTDALVLLGKDDKIEYIDQGTSVNISKGKVQIGNIKYEFYLEQEGRRVDSSAFFQPIFKDGSLMGSVLQCSHMSGGNYTSVRVTLKEVQSMPTDKMTGSTKLVIKKNLATPLK